MKIKFIFRNLIKDGNSFALFPVMYIDWGYADYKGKTFGINIAFLFFELTLLFNKI